VDGTPDGVALRTTASLPRDMAAAKKSKFCSADRVPACPAFCAAARADAAARATGTSVRKTAVSAAGVSPSPAGPPGEGCTMPPSPTGGSSGPPGTPSGEASVMRGMYAV